MRHRAGELRRRAGDCGTGLENFGAEPEIAAQDRRIAAQSRRLRHRAGELRRRAGDCGTGPEILRHISDSDGKEDPGEEDSGAEDSREKDSEEKDSGKTDFMMITPFVKIDLHGMRREEAVKEIDRALAAADSTTYQIQIVHGYNRGTNLRTMIYEEYRYDPKIKRITPGDNPGITVLVLKELY